jgi:pimeloyl-ACP methyl ester carboxylesterase
VRQESRDAHGGIVGAAIVTLFHRLLQAVPQTLRVFAMDRRGNGDVDKPADGYAPANFADDIEAFMDSVGLRSSVLLGSSSGG